MEKLAAVLEFFLVTARRSTIPDNWLHLPKLPCPYPKLVNLYLTCLLTEDAELGGL